MHGDLQVKHDAISNIIYHAPTELEGQGWSWDHSDPQLPPTPFLLVSPEVSRSWSDESYLSLSLSPVVASILLWGPRHTCGGVVVAPMMAEGGPMPTS